ncbi:MAG: hypothetical protein AAFU85_31940 [Planctomycetota bacterium]
MMADFTLSERIELLAEGELSSDQRYQLIDELDAQPARWREAAFALMEQRKVHSAVGAVIAEDRAGATQPRESVVASSPQLVRKRSIESLGRVIGLAAVFLAIFSFGLVAGRRHASSQTESSRASLSTENQLAKTLSHSSSNAPVLIPRVGSDLAVGSVQGAGNSNAQQAGSNEQGIVGYVHWRSRVGITRLPVFDGSASEQWLAANPPRIDERLARVLARSGWQVTPARRLVSMQFDSGDTFTIPIDDLTYQYVGQQVF